MTQFLPFLGFTVGGAIAIFGGILAWKQDISDRQSKGDQKQSQSVGKESNSKSDLPTTTPEGSPDSWNEVDVILTAVGDRTAEVIEEVRALTSLGLKEATEIVEAADATPATVIKNVNRDEAEEAANALLAIGASVTIRGKRPRPQSKHYIF